MPKEAPIPHINEAPTAVQQQVRAAQQNCLYGADIPVPAIGYVEAIQCATAAGYLLFADPADVPTPAHDELARLREIDPAAAGEMTISRSLDLQYEEQARTLAAQAPAIILRQRANRARAHEQAKTATREKQIAARTAEILAETEKSAFEKARRRAEKEVSA